MCSKCEALREENERLAEAYSRIAAENAKLRKMESKMEETVRATECGYDGIKIDEQIIHHIDTLQIMFDQDVGEGFNLMYETPRVLHGIWGFETEVGEIKDALKKSLFYRKELDVINVVEEVGDCLYYVVMLEDELGESFYGTRDALNRIAKHYGYSLDECSEKVTSKLRIRYPDGFATANANSRDLTAERESLETST